MGLHKNQCVVGVSAGTVNWQRVNDPGFGTGDAYELDTGQLPSANDYGYIVPRDDVIAPVGDSVLRAKVRTPYQSVSEIPGGQLTQRAPYFNTNVNAVIAHEDFGAGWAAFASPEDNTYAYGHLWAKSNGPDSFFHHLQWIQSNYDSIGDGGRIRNRLEVDSPWGQMIVGDLLMPAGTPTAPGYAALVANPPQNLAAGQIVRFNDVQFEPLTAAPYTPSRFPYYSGFFWDVIGTVYSGDPSVPPAFPWWEKISVMPHFNFGDISMQPSWFSSTQNAHSLEFNFSQAVLYPHARAPYRIPEAKRFVITLTLMTHPSSTYGRRPGIALIKTDANDTFVGFYWYINGDVHIVGSGFTSLVSQTMSSWAHGDRISLKLDITFSPSLSLQTYIHPQGATDWIAGPTYSDPAVDWGGAAPVPAFFNYEPGAVPVNYQIDGFGFEWYP